MNELLKLQKNINKEPQKFSAYYKKQEIYIEKDGKEVYRLCMPFSEAQKLCKILGLSDLKDYSNQSG